MEKRYYLEIPEDGLKPFEGEIPPDAVLSYDGNIDIKYHDVPYNLKNPSDLIKAVDLLIEQGDTGNTFDIILRSVKTMLGALKPVEGVNTPDGYYLLPHQREALKKAANQCGDRDPNLYNFGKTRFRQYDICDGGLSDEIGYARGVTFNVQQRAIKAISRYIVLMVMLERMPDGATAYYLEQFILTGKDESGICKLRDNYKHGAESYKTMQMLAERISGLLKNIVVV